jgi:uncharacterized membrane protein YbhN (UPF0104 family)
MEVGMTLKTFMAVLLILEVALTITGLIVYFVISGLGDSINYPRATNLANILVPLGVIISIPSAIVLVVRTTVRVRR